MTIPAKVKVCGCIGPLTSQKSGKQFYLVHAETPNDGEWSTIRWTAVTEKPIAVGAEVGFAVRTLDTEKGEGAFYVR